MPIRVLVVEDEAIVAADLADHLRTAGMEVVGGAARGENALDLARRVRPDVILLDVRLAGEITGAEVADAIRRDGLETGLVFLTAHQDSFVREQVGHLEPFELVYKPFEEDVLLEAVRSAAWGR